MLVLPGAVLPGAGRKEVMPVNPIEVTVDGDRCCGAGTCVILAPEVFDQRDEDGTVVLLDPAPAAKLHEAVGDAADQCPGRAIEVREAGS